MLAARVEHGARAQPWRQRGNPLPSKASSIPSSRGPQPAWEALLGCFCWSPLLFNTPCWSPWRFLGAEMLQPPWQRCPRTTRALLEVARAWSGCGDTSGSHRELQLQNPGDLLRAYCRRGEDHAARAGFPAP